MNSADYFQQVQQKSGWHHILESFARFVAPPPHSRLIDLGCGPGALLTIFRHNFQTTAIGLDADMQMVQRFDDKQHPAVVASLPHLPFANAQFEIATATNVLYLLDDPMSALQEIRRILKPNGVFAMLTPSPRMNVATATQLADARGLEGFARQNFIQWGEIAETHLRWSAEDIDELFAQAGLTLAETQSKIGDGLALYAKGIAQ